MFAKQQQWNLRQIAKRKIEHLILEQSNMKRIDEQPIWHIVLLAYFKDQIKDQIRGKIYLFHYSFNGSQNSIKLGEFWNLYF